ncbi:uncharacterized protein [Engystomops pustulosus]|uniref:uncharacterized protein n=1 Tax=Engystomops pustulosus TaxID=76066 RepID=UPI003AFB5E4D
MWITGIISILLSGGVWSWTVSQWPESVHVYEGEPVVLHCSITHHVSSPSAVTFHWSWKNTIVFQFQNIQGHKQQNVSSLDGFQVFLSNDLSRSNLTIAGVTPEDSARYICGITIHSPLPRMYRKGNGTLVNVVEGPITGPSSSHLEVPNFPSSLPVIAPPAAPLCLILFSAFVFIVSCMFLGSWIHPPSVQCPALLPLLALLCVFPDSATSCASHFSSFGQ